MNAPKGIGHWRILFGWTLLCGLWTMAARAEDSSLPPKPTPGKIILESSFWAQKYTLKGEVLDEDMLLSRFEPYPEAQDDYYRGQSESITAKILAGAGGILILWPIGEAVISAAPPHWLLAGIGVGALIPAFLLQTSAKTHFFSAVDIYNQHVENQPPQTGGWRFAVGFLSMSCTYQF